MGDIDGRYVPGDKIFARASFVCKIARQTTGEVKQSSDFPGFVFYLFARGMEFVLVLFELKYLFLTRCLKLRFD